MRMKNKDEQGKRKGQTQFSELVTYWLIIVIVLIKS